jgi:hypothetical protein
VHARMHHSVSAHEQGVVFFANSVGNTTAMSIVERNLNSRVTIAYFCVVYEA